MSIGEHPGSGRSPDVAETETPVAEHARQPLTFCPSCPLPFRRCSAGARSRTLVEMTDASNAAQPATVVTVYPMTGRQLFLNVPHAVCEECDLTVRLVQRVASDLPHVQVRIKPWFNHIFDALRRGGWHPPVVTIDGKVTTQGVVPDEGELRSALARVARPADGT